MSTKTSENLEEMATDYQNQDFEAISPICADTEELSSQGRRVILLRERAGAGKRWARIIVAPKFILNSGFVIGLIRE